MIDPAAPFSSPEAACEVMRAAGYRGVWADASLRPRLRRRNSEQHAAAVGQQWAGFPGLPLAELVSPAALAAAKAAFMADAFEAAVGAAVPGGIREEHAVLLVAGKA